jgi:glucose/arabinose dehydrogenase
MYVNAHMKFVRIASMMVVAAVLLPGVSGAPEASVLPPWLVQVAGGLDMPVGITHAGDERLFIVLQRGQIMILRDGAIEAVPFLDIRPAVACCGERGLLGLAFPPDHAETGYFFVHYTDLGGDTMISRFRVMPGDPDRADPASETTVLTATQPFENHNGGQIEIGPDGMLWIALGDGGNGGDPLDNAQSLGTLLGKILRIDVDELPYTIPPDNPFIGQEGARAEIWSYGWRNPWRFSFDRATGDLYVGDVGQNRFEEISLERAGSPGGGNYGWRLMEGLHCFIPSSNCNDGSLILPIIEYATAGGNCAVTGGYVYRGGRIPALEGKYLFSDFCSGLIWMAEETGEVWEVETLFQSGLRVSSLGEDDAGEIYIADYSRGGIYKISRDLPRRRAVGRR